MCIEGKERVGAIETVKDHGGYAVGRWMEMQPSLLETSP